MRFDLERLDVDRGAGLAEEFVVAHLDHHRPRPAVAGRLDGEHGPAQGAVKPISRAAPEIGAATRMSFCPV